MRTSTIALLVLAGVATALGQITVKFHDLPLDLALAQYAEWTGKSVEIVQGVNARITLLERDLSQTQATALLEQELKNQNIGLFAITSNRLVAAWLDASKAPIVKRISYAERLRQRREETKNGNAASSNEASQAIGAPGAPQPER